MSTQPSLLIPIALLAALLAAPVLEAAKTDREQPMEVNADRQSGGLGENDSLVLTGNVQIVQGTLRIQAARATVEREAGEIARIVLDGAPVQMDQQTDRGEPVNAKANRITYSPNDELLLLAGSAQVTQPRGTLRSETIRYSLDSGNVDSGGDGSRVQMILTPKTRPAPN